MSEKPKSMERFEIVKMMRSELIEADYNPRKISEANKQKLKRSLKTHGLVVPIVVNRRNNAIVGGHQRVTVMDEIKRGADYELTVALIDVDERQEVEINSLLNNETLMGEFDPERLIGLKDIFPDIDYQRDLGFDQMDLDFLFSADAAIMDKAGAMEEAGEAFIRHPVQKQIETDIEKMKAMKLEHKQAARAANAEGESYVHEKDDYILSIVFNCNSDKKEFMQKIHKPIGDRHVKASVLYDLEQGKYKK